MLKRNPLIESTNSPIATSLRPSLYGTQSQGGAVRRQAEDINCCIATDDGLPLCHSARSSAFKKIPFVEPQTLRRAVAMSVQQLSSYEKRQHKIPSRLITSKQVNVMQKWQDTTHICLKLICSTSDQFRELHLNRAHKCLQVIV